MLEISVILAVVFLVVGVLAIGKMHDAQQERDKARKEVEELEEFYEEVSAIINSQSYSSDTKVAKIWELL